MYIMIQFFLFVPLQKTLPVISNVKELMNLIQVIKLAKEKLNCSYVQTYINVSFFILYIHFKIT